MTRILRRVIIYAALFVTGILAIPAGVCVCMIMVIWKLTDILIRNLERYPE